MKLSVLFLCGLLATFQGIQAVCTASSGGSPCSGNFCDLSLGSSAACTGCSGCSASVPYGDPSTGTCVASCSAANPYVDHCLCVAAGACYFSTGEYTDAGLTPKGCTACVNPCCSTGYPYQDNTARQCVAAGACVTAGQFTDAGTTPKACVATTACSTGYPYQDATAKACVAAGACNSANPYQDPNIKRCVVATGCTAANPYSDAGASPKACVVATSCSSGLPYGDPTAKACVAAGACNSANPYQDPTTKTCVAIGSCNSANAYADPTPSPKVCVAATSCNAANPYGDPSTGKCVTTCPTGSTASATTKLCSAASGSPSTDTAATASVSSSVFVNGVGPNLVWDSTGKDADWYAEVPPPLAVFGPGTDNSTVYAYGGVWSGASLPYTGGTITSRSINATLVSNATSTTESSVIGDKQATFTDTIQDSPAVCIGYGSVAVVYPGTDGTNNQLHLTIASGTTATTVALTSATPATNTVYNFEDYQCWYDPVGIYYVAWTTQVETSPNSNPTYAETAVNVQGVNATNLKTIWSTAASVTLTNGQGTASLIGGGSNDSNSSIIYLAYLVGSNTNTASLSLTLVNAASGTINSTRAAITTNSQKFYYAPTGFISSNNLNGLVISLGNSSSSYVTSYILYNISNSTLGTSAIVTNTPSSYTALTLGEGQEYGSSGWTSGQGYGVGFLFQTDGEISYVYQTYYQNGTTNVTMNIGTVPVPGSDFTASYPANFFVDPNGALWFGYTLFDETSGSNQGNAIKGYVGKLVAQTRSSSSAGKSLVALFSLLFCAVISIVILA